MFLLCKWTQVCEQNSSEKHVHSGMNHDSPAPPCGSTQWQSADTHTHKAFGPFPFLKSLMQTVLIEMLMPFLLRGWKQKKLLIVSNEIRDNARKNPFYFNKSETLCGLVFIVWKPYICIYYISVKPTHPYSSPQFFPHPLHHFRSQMFFFEPLHSLSAAWCAWVWAHLLEHFAKPRSCCFHWHIDH